MKTLPKDTQIFTCAITLGEITAGHEMTAGGLNVDAARRHRVRAFLNLEIIPNVISISHSTETYYGQILGRIWRRTPPPKASVSTDSHLVALGININDVWIVACAWEHNLTLLTTDKMTPIKDTTPEVNFDNWC